ncbi:MAG: signal peptide peptidase SppA [candidate division Zixibacteria bacterium]|jgi:protease-4|nr:signal peptide peptidase SppA [candidate division Zixibacteria bacterium]
MARKRDVVIGVIIAGAFIVAFGMFALIFISLFSETGGVGFAGIGGDVGVIEVFGVLDESMGREVIRQLDKWGEGGSVKALVLHVNSPGGGVAISQEIYDAINRVRDNGKPVVVSMASVAASGGYYISCAADAIVANPGTLTGSIGVIMQFPTAEGLMEKIGLKLETVKSGELKDVGSFDRDMTEEEELMLRSVVMDTYEQFVEVVAEGRGKDREEVYVVADGSIYTGHQAYNLGLVDSLGGLNEAIHLAAEMAGLTGEPSVVRPYRREQVGLLDLLGSFSDVAQRVTATVDRGMLGPQVLYLYQ